MTESNPNPVVVAVGDDSIDAALVFAAGEATRAGCGIHLLHVVHLFVSGTDPVFIEETDQERMGRESLNAALKRARDLAGPDTELSSDLVLGRVVPTVVEESKDARMIVLEHRDLSSARRLVTRSVAGGVAAHARVPVVSVPAGTSPRRPGRSRPGDRRRRRAGGVRTAVAGGRASRPATGVPPARAAHLELPQRLRRPGDEPHRGGASGWPGRRARSPRSWTASPTRSATSRCGSTPGTPGPRTRWSRRAAPRSWWSSGGTTR